MFGDRFIIEMHEMRERGEKVPGENTKYQQMDRILNYIRESFLIIHFFDHDYLPFPDPGYYLYTPSGSHYLQTARLISPVQDGRTEPVICFQMWYNMNGENMGSLQVNWRGENDDSVGGTLWRREGGTGNIWQLANVDFYPPEILFEVSRKTPFNSSMTCFNFDPPK